MNKLLYYIFLIHGNTSLHLKDWYRQTQLQHNNINIYIIATCVHMHCEYTLQNIIFFIHGNIHLHLQIQHWYRQTQTQHDNTNICIIVTCVNMNCEYTTKYYIFPT